MEFYFNNNGTTSNESSSNTNSTTQNSGKGSTRQKFQTSASGTADIPLLHTIKPVSTKKNKDAIPKMCQYKRYVFLDLQTY